MKRAAIFLVVLVTACGNGDGSNPPTTETTNTTSPPTTPTTLPSTTGSVSTRETSLGTVLVDPDGLTMYVFTSDRPNESVCYESCAAIWPPVPGDVAIGSGLNPSMFGTTTRTDGSSQLTVNGRPLYLWVSDTQPGDVTGQGVEDVWFVVSPSGEMIGAPSAPADEYEDPYDY